MTKPTTLLIDGDILCYKAAWKAQETIDWEDGDKPSVFTDKAKAHEFLMQQITDIRRALGRADYLVCLSDDRNWRKELWPEYKANRKDLPRPELLQFCKNLIKDKLNHSVYPRLEADDVMGILQTNGSLGSTIIVSVDKDMKTIPGRLYNPNHPEDGVVTVSPVDAFHYHMTQTLTGDSTDGYKGCPGIGPKKAAAILDAVERPTSTKQYQKWRIELWQRSRKAYLERGLTENDALLNARLSNMLTTGRYNLETHKVKLWQPPR